MEPTRGTVLLGWGLGGLVLGRLLRPVAEQLLGIAPTVGWSQPLGLVVIAGVLGVTARATAAVVRGHGLSLAPHRAVNRLVVARSSAVVGALVAGCYAGYAVAWIGSDSALAGQRILFSGLSVLAALAVVGTALLLERACRVPPPDSDT